MAKKALLRDHDNIEILPITRGELVLDSSGKVALHSNEFLASNSRPGLMSAEDKAALNSLAGGTIDSDLSTTSTNPVQNKVVTNAINSIKTSYLKSATVSTNTLTIVDQSNKETKFYNTTYGVVTQAADGLAPKLGTYASATIGTQADEWVLTSTKGSAPTWRKLPVNAFKNDNNNTTYTFASGNGGFTVTPSGGTAQTVSIGKPATAGTADKLVCEAASTNSFRHVWFSYDGEDGRLVYDNDFTYNPATNVLNVGSITGSAGSVAWGNITGRPDSFTPAAHNHTTEQITSLSNYIKATAISALAATDTLNTALGKLEYKADVAYNLVKGAYDGDGTIENLEEILRVLDGIKDTETIKAIVGKYLPLTGGTITGILTAKSAVSVYGRFSIYGLQEYRTPENHYVFVANNYHTGSGDGKGLAIYTNSHWYDFLHEGNYNSYAPKLDGTGATGTWNININGNAKTATALSQNIFNTGHDLNTIASESVYIHSQTNVCASLVNGPEGRTNGEIRLESVNCGTDYYGFQTLYTKGTKNYEIWYRAWSNSEYTPWVKALHSGIAYIENGAITINGTSITPITSHQDLSNYRRLDTTQMYGTEICSQYYIDRCKAGGGGWAYAPITVFKGDKTSKLLNIGVYGCGDALTYSYIGQNEWTGANLRIYPAGNIYCVGAEINGHTSTKGASVAGYASSGSITKISELGDQGLYVGFNSRVSWGLTMWVEGNGKGYIQQQAWTTTATTYALCLQPFGGNVGIGTNNPTTKLEVAGDVLSTGYYLKEASTVTPQNMFGWYLWSNTVQFTKRDTSNTYIKELLGINLTTETTTVTGTFKVSGNSSITGDLTAAKLIKSGSSDAYVLLGAGGHKAVSDFMLKSDELTNNLTTITKSITLTKDWQDTGISINSANFPNGSGTYAVQVYIDDGNQNFWGSYFSGIMSVYIYATNASVPDDEILLHHASHACSKQIYLKTKPVVGSTDYNKLYIACNTNCSSAISIVFKFKKLI